MSNAISSAKENVHFCSKCYNYATSDLCDICEDKMRDKTKICVVCEPRNIPPIERTGSYNGLYHVLGGEISPMDGIGPENLNIQSLINRLSDKSINEVIIATNPNIEGETTATYLSRQMAVFNIKITRPASGIPIGGDLEFTDELTLGKAFEDRREI